MTLIGFDIKQDEFDTHVKKFGYFEIKCVRVKNVNVSKFNKQIKYAWEMYALELDKKNPIKTINNHQENNFSVRRRLVSWKGERLLFKTEIGISAKFRSWGAGSFCAPIALEESIICCLSLGGRHECGSIRV